MYHIGVVGPGQSVERILDVAREFEKELRFHPFTYKKAVETKEIVMEHKDQVDAWLFSGPIPYSIAKGVLGDDESLHGVLFLETGLYKSFLNLLLQNRNLKKLSIDLPEGANISDEALSQLDVQENNLEIKTFQPDIDENDIYEYHYRLWKKGNTDGVLTCYPSVKDRLAEHGIPVSWITTTRLETKQTLLSLSEKAKTHYYQNTQVAVCFIETENPELEKEELLYNMQWTELKMDEILLRASRSLNGSFHKTGSGDYMIFSSRGEVYEQLNTLHKAIEKIQSDLNRPVAAGIGFGDSVLKAEFNARKAVQRSKSSKHEKIILIDEHGVVEEYRHEQLIISYVSESTEPELVKKLGEYHISVQLFNKIKSYVERKNWNTFTSKDIALELGMSNRNSQRILQGLRKAGLIIEIGETKSHDKGRPMKLYCFKQENSQE